MTCVPQTTYVRQTTIFVRTRPGEDTERTQAVSAMTVDRKVIHATR